LDHSKKQNTFWSQAAEQHGGPRRSPSFKSARRVSQSAAAAVSQSVCSVAQRVSARRTNKYEENIVTIILRDFGVVAVCNRAVAVAVIVVRR